MFVKGRIENSLWCILLLMVLVTYANSLFNGFVWDDSQIIVNNPVNRDFGNIIKLFTSADVAFSDNVTPYFRPLNRFTYMLDYQLFGLNPFWYHLENILIHLVNVFLLYYLLARQIFNRPFPAAIAALLFAVHPANAEAVNFISGRNNLLAVSFVLLAIIFYLRTKTKSGLLNPLLAGMFLFAGVLCKETALMAVPLVFFFELVPGQRAEGEGRRRVNITYGCLTFFTLLYLVMRHHALTAIEQNMAWGGIWGRVANNIYIIPKYMALLLYPMKLNAAYAIPREYGAAEWWLAIAWLTIIGVTVYLLTRKKRDINFGLYWFAVTFIPISNLVPIPSSPMAERYIYMPAIGVWIVAGALLGQLAETKRTQELLTAAVAVTCLALAMVTFMRNRVWMSDLSLFQSMVRSQPDAFYGHYNLGNAYRERGDLASAQHEWETTVALNRNHSQAWNQLGNIHLMSRSLKLAEYDFSMALRANPVNAEAHYNLATVLEELGRAGEAVSHYEQFLRQVPPEHAAVIPELQGRVRQLKQQVVQ